MLNNVVDIGELTGVVFTVDLLVVIVGAFVVDGVVVDVVPLFDAFKKRPIVISNSFIFCLCVKIKIIV